MTSIYVDFNDFDASGRLTALVDDADDGVVPGNAVILRDSEGNKCEADVVSVDASGVVHLELRWDTWNKVKTFLDALTEVQEAVATFKPGTPLDPTPSGLDPANLPSKQVTYS